MDIGKSYVQRFAHSQRELLSLTGVEQYYVQPCSNYIVQSCMHLQTTRTTYTNKL